MARGWFALVPNPNPDPNTNPNPDPNPNTNPNPNQLTEMIRGAGARPRLGMSRLVSRKWPR